MLRQGRQLANILMGAGRATAVGSLLSRGFQSSTASQNVVEQVWQESWDKVTNMYKSAKTNWDTLLLAIEDNVEIPTDPEDSEQVKKYVKQMDAAFAAAGLENNLPVHFQQMLRDEWEAAPSIEAFLTKLNLPQDDIAAITTATGGRKDKQAMQAAVEELLKKDGVVPNTRGNLDHLKETMAHMTLAQIKEHAENIVREEKERLEREFGVKGIPLPEYKDVVPKRISAE